VTVTKGQLSKQYCCNVRFASITSTSMSLISPFAFVARITLPVIVGQALRTSASACEAITADPQSAVMEVPNWN
jgi:hypothetical protein